jgi:hypothetical protein
MSTAERIQELLDCAVRVPARDGAGVITPAGVDAAIEVKTLQRCLKIAAEEESERLD